MRTPSATQTPVDPCTQAELHACACACTFVHVECVSVFVCVDSGSSLSSQNSSLTPTDLNAWKCRADFRLRRADALGHVAHQPHHRFPRAAGTALRTRAAGAVLDGNVAVAKEGLVVGEAERGRPVTRGATRADPVRTARGALAEGKGGCAHTLVAEGLGERERKQR